ncbi:hypothetical protein JCM10207_005129 [Rhodosporidiobolus poonsookiae]
MDPPATLSILDSLLTSRHTLTHRVLPPLSPSADATLTPLTTRTSTLSIGPHFFRHASLALASFPRSSSSSSSAPAASEPAPVTPALIARLNENSLSDPALSALMRRAASGQASPDELQRLQRYIDGLRAADPSLSAAPAAAGAGGGEAPRHPCVVVEFEDNPAVKFVLPESTQYTPLPGGSILVPFPPSPPPPSSSGQQGQTQDILLSFFTTASKDGTPVPVDLVVHGAETRVREGLWSAARNSRARDEAVEGVWRQMIASVPPRTHVLHIPPPRPSPAAEPTTADPSRQASEVPGTAAGPSGSGAAAGAGTKRAGSGTPAGGGQGPAKKARVAPKRKAAPRASARSRSKASATPATPVAGSPSASASASAAPSSLAGSPEPSGAKGKGGARGGKRKAPARGKRRGVKKEEEEEDGEFGE